MIFDFRTLPETRGKSSKRSKKIFAQADARPTEFFLSGEIDLSIPTKISRRSLAKTLAAAGAATSFSGWFGADSATAEPLTATAWSQVYPGVWRATVGSPEKFTPVSSRLVPPQADAFNNLPRDMAAPRLLIESTRTDRGCTVSLALRPAEEIFGFGLQLLSFAQRGKKRIARVNADPKVDTGDSNAPVPFYVTTEGYGILVDTARYASFYFGDARPKPTRAVAEAVNGANPDPNYMHTVKENDESYIVIEVPHAPGVDLYLFAGPGMLNAVRRYNVFSGGGFTPPEWGLGFWYRHEARATQQNVLDLANEFRERKIPCDVLGLEPGWQSHAYSCTFVWDRDRFPDPKGFVHSATELQYKINLWEHAFTNPASPLFSLLEQYSGSYGVWGGLVPDFAGHEARDIFGDFHGKTLVDMGISGFKLDECDNSDFTGGWSFPECSAFPSDIDGEQMHSVFGLRYQMAIWDAFRKRNQSTYALVRSSGALAAPYPFVLYSDLYDHRQYIRALVNSGFSGLLWCPEVRQAANQDDLIRRLQSVVFSPLAQVDCWYMKSPPWKQLDRAKNNAGELLENWEALESRCREIIGWRMQMLPYLLAAFQRYQQDGTPPFRALVLDFPQDKRLYTVDDQYMIGDRMMVAPLFAGEPGRKVVFPDCGWHDFWTGEAIAGGTAISVSASTEGIPVYVKTGSIVPWADIGLHTGASETRRIVARVYGDGSLPFTLESKEAALRLSWKNDQGSAQSGKYQVYRWQHLG
jgi:alpha-D-xyloside xylohydrolase